MRRVGCGNIYRRWGCSLEEHLKSRITRDGSRRDVGG